MVQSWLYIESLIRKQTGCRCFCLSDCIIILCMNLSFVSMIILSALWSMLFGEPGVIWSSMRTNCPQIIPSRSTKKPSDHFYYKGRGIDSEQVVLANCTNLCVFSIKTRLQNLRLDLNQISSSQSLSFTVRFKFNVFLAKICFLSCFDVLVVWYVISPLFIVF